MRDFLLASSPAVLVHPVQLRLIAAVNVCAFTLGFHTCTYFANAFSIACAIIEILPPGQAGGLGGQYSGTAGRIPEISRYVVPYVLRTQNPRLLWLKVPRYASTVPVSFFRSPPAFGLPHFNHQWLSLEVCTIGLYTYKYSVYALTTVYSSVLLTVTPFLCQLDSSAPKIHIPCPPKLSTTIHAPTRHVILLQDLTESLTLAQYQVVVPL